MEKSTHSTSASRKSIMPNSDLFKYLHKVFLYFGLSKVSESRGLKAVLYDIYAISMKLIVICASVSFICNIYNMDKLSVGVFSNYVGATCTCTVTAVKIIICEVNKIPDQFDKIFRKEAEMSSVKDKYLKKILSSTTEPILRAFLIYMFAVVMTNVSFIGLCGYLRYIEAEGEESLHPFEMWLPFDRDQHYSLTLLAYMLTETVTAFMAYAMDMTLLVFIILHILRLKFLQHVLRNFKHYICDREFRKCVDEKVTYEETAFFWGKCIFEHQVIISDVELLNKQISKLFFIDFFLRTIQMAGFCLGGIRADQFMNQFFGFGCLMCSSSQLTILYWYGEVLTSESVAISDAIYESEWYDTDPEIRKTMLMMMRRSQRCLILTVGKFDKVALKTVLKILKSIYSCMSIIVQRQ